MFRAHVLIIGSSKLHYTPSGIITAIGGRLVHEMHGQQNVKKTTCFEQFLCPSSGVFHCTHSSGICHTACEQDQDGTCILPWSCSQAVSKSVWHIPPLCVQWKTPDDGQRNSPKHVEFYYENALSCLDEAETRREIFVRSSVYEYHENRRREDPALLVGVNGVTGANVLYNRVTFERQITIVQSKLRHTVRRVAILLYTINCYVILC